jgi:geranylgeranyl diphosphate synthase type II
MPISNSKRRIEARLRSALSTLDGPAQPPRLGAALNAAVFPAGGRLRPRLCLAVADACGAPAALADAAAAAIELVHCASLVHDDLPAFDDAATRRGQPTVHAVYGEALAVLVGDGLIALAFDVLASAAAAHPLPVGRLTMVLAQAMGAGRGLVAGQAWEAEPVISLRQYHRAKTAALFEAAAVMGAICGDADPEPWRRMAAAIGEAYQVADDLADALGEAADMGKPVGQDAALQRPSAADELGIDGAFVRLNALREEAMQALPDVPGRARIAMWLNDAVERLLPSARAAAV